MPAYTRVNWTNVSGTALDAANLNVMDASLATAVQTDGSQGMTAALPTTQTLGGANHVYYDLIATDGKRYQLIITTGGTFAIYDYTDSKTVAEFGPNTANVLNGLTVALMQSAGGGAAGRTNWVGTTDPGSNAAEGDLWFNS